MKKLKTAILSLAIAILPFSGMAQGVQQPSSIPAQQTQQPRQAQQPQQVQQPQQGQQGETQISQEDLAKAITQALTQAASDEQDMMQEQVSITVGEKRVLSVPFSIESCKSDSSNVKIERVTGSTFEISGSSPGQALVIVHAGGIEKEYHVTVFNSTLQTYQELSRLLEELPEITLHMYDGGLVLRGIVTQPLHWDYFRRIMQSYENRCNNYVSFIPDAKLITDLKKQLANAGFPVEDKSGPEYPGKLSMNLTGTVLTVRGHLYSEQGVQTVQSILAAQRWLNPEWNANNVTLQTDLRIAPAQIDLGIVFVGVTRTQLERLGNSLADGTVLTWDVIGWFKAMYNGNMEAIDNHFSQQGGGSTTLKTTLKGALTFFGNNGISDFRDAGHITLTSNGGESSFENGGTRQVMVYGENSADIKEIEFGLKYKAQAFLQEDNTVKLDLELERSLPPVRDDRDYVQSKSKTKTSLLCPLGQTAIIAGQKELTFIHNGPSGYAFLRHVPVINWFASSSEDKGEEVQMLILVSPELMHQNTQISARPSEENASLEQEVSERVNVENQKVLENEEKSWFQRMFTW